MNASSSPLTCPCELCAQWRRERDLLRADVREVVPSRELLPVGDEFPERGEAS